MPANNEQTTEETTTAEQYVVTSSMATIGYMGMRRGETFTMEQLTTPSDPREDRDALIRARFDRLVGLKSVKPVSELTDEEKASFGWSLVPTLDVNGVPVPVHNISDQAGGAGAVTEPGNPNSPQALPAIMTEGSGADPVALTNSVAVPANKPAENKSAPSK